MSASSQMQAAFLKEPLHLVIKQNDVYKLYLYIRNYCTCRQESSNSKTPPMCHLSSQVTC